MIAVVLDASCLRKEGLVSPAMLELARLAENGRVVVVLPEMAVREHLSQQEDELAANLDAAVKNLKSVARGLRIPDPPVQELDRLTGAVAELERPLRKAYTAGFNAWADRCKARQIKFDGARIDEVVNDYFSGTGAFSVRKARKDFPDALILSSVRAAASEFEHFHLVAADEHLRFAAGRLGMECHESLLHFLDAPATRRVREALATEQKIWEFSDALLSADNLDRIATWLRAGNDELEGIRLEHEEIDGLEGVGVTVYGATIDYPISEAIKFLVISLASPRGDDKWALSMSFETKCELRFVTSWPESIKLKNERDITIECSDDVVELGELWWAHFDAEIVVDMTQWQPGVDTRTFTIEMLKPKLLVNRAVLLRPA